MKIFHKLFLFFITNISCTNRNSYNIHFFSALTLGLKKDDIGFMPLLSTLARLFWAAVIFLGGWNRGGGGIKMITWRPCRREFITYRTLQFKLKNTNVQGWPLWPMCIKCTDEACLQKHNLQTKLRESIQQTRTKLTIVQGLQNNLSSKQKQSNNHFSYSAIIKTNYQNHQSLQ